MSAIACRAKVPAVSDQVLPPLIDLRMPTP
jgi:hypothetical protein